MLSAKHLAILAQLRTDARMSLANISRATGIATSTIFDYYSQLAKKAVLKHVCLLDFKALGYPLRKHFLIRVEERAKALAWLKRQAAVNNLYRVDEYDAFFDAYFADAAELEDFKNGLTAALKPHQVKEFDILEELQQEAFVPKRV